MRFPFNKKKHSLTKTLGFFLLLGFFVSCSAEEKVEESFVEVQNSESKPKQEMAKIEWNASYETTCQEAKAFSLNYVKRMYRFLNENTLLYTLAEYDNSTCQQEDLHYVIQESYRYEINEAESLDGSVLIDLIIFEAQLTMYDRVLYPVLPCEVEWTQGETKDILLLDCADGGYNYYDGYTKRPGDRLQTMIKISDDFLDSSVAPIDREADYNGNIPERNVFELDPNERYYLVR